MKRKAWRNHLIGAILAFLLSVSAVGNPATGFGLSTASLPGLILWCAGWSLVSSFLFGFRHGGKALLCLLALASPFVWKDGQLWDQLRSLCCTITRDYHDVYGWPVLGEKVTDAVNRPLLVLSALVACCVSWTVCRRKHPALAITAAVLPLAPCLAITNQLPDAVYLYLLMLGIALLLVTDWTRRNHPGQDVRLMLRLAVPVAAALALLFLLHPQEHYVNRAGEYQKEVLSWFQDLAENAESVGSGVSFEAATSDKLNLKSVGPKSRISYAVMRVKSPVDGTVYLRGRDYDLYSGTGWEASTDRREYFTSGGASSGELHIETYGVRDVLYVPYYAAGEITLIDGALDNDENLKKYSYTMSRTVYGSSYSPAIGYTLLPAETLQWAAELDIIREVEACTYSEKIRRIADYVEQSAVYDLGTSRMDSGYGDFARWFLEESDTGYCVHFATAAVVLLRAAEVPARYVEGYAVSCKAGESAVVFSRDAHAWAEYYDYSSGAWCILEATPADFRGDEPEDDGEPDGEEIPTEPTEPESTEEPEPDPVHEPEQKPQPQTKPQPGDGTGTTGSAENRRPYTIPDWVITVFWITALAALVPLQSRIRMKWKRQRWERGSSNEKLLTRWREVKQTARILRQPFPQELDSLAQKACFSQYKIGRDELQLFADYRQTLLDIARNKQWYQKLLLRWIFAIG